MNGPTTMQIGDRLQHASSKNSLRQRRQPLAAFEPNVKDTDPAPKSAARLAAEAAFAAPVFNAAPTAQTQITIRRTRAAEPFRRAQTDGDTTPASPMTRQGPRVFRVQAAQTVQPAQPANLPASFEGRSLADMRSGDHADIQTVPPTRCMTASRRPGPVVHLVHPVSNRCEPDQGNEHVPEVEPEIETEINAHKAQPQWAALTAELARIGLVLEQIKRAQSFKLIDDEFADHITREWGQISCSTEGLRLEIENQLRRHHA